MQQMQNVKNATAQISTNITPKQSISQQKNSSSFDEMVNFYKTQSNAKNEQKLSATKKLQSDETVTRVDNAGKKLPKEKIDASDKNVEVAKKTDASELSENEIEQLAQIDDALKEKINCEEKNIPIENFDVLSISKKAEKIENVEEEIVVASEENAALLSLINVDSLNKTADVQNTANEQAENVAAIAETQNNAEVAATSVATVPENVRHLSDIDSKKSEIEMASGKEVPEEIVADAKRDAMFGNIEVASDTNSNAESGEKNQAGKNADGSRTWKFDSEGKITVTDYRTQAQTQTANVQNVAVSTNSEIDVAKNAGSEEINTIQMNMNLAQTAEQNILSSNTQTASAHGSDFQAMLANQIQENAGEFVKAGSIVLRDGDMGEINLTLNPEKLGNVKISLQLSDKVIAGQITVASREAYNAFKESSETLRQAFIQNGFEMDALNVSWAGQNAANSFAENQNDGSKQFAASRAYGEYAVDGAETERFANEYGAYENNAVNVTA